jgi:hypothetical protein
MHIPSCRSAASIQAHGVLRHEVAPRVPLPIAHIFYSKPKHQSAGSSILCSTSSTFVLEEDEGLTGKRSCLCHGPIAARCSRVARLMQRRHQYANNRQYTLLKSSMSANLPCSYCHINAEVLVVIKSLRNLSIYIGILNPAMFPSCFIPRNSDWSRDPATCATATFRGMKRLGNISSGASAFPADNADTEMQQALPKTPCTRGAVLHSKCHSSQSVKCAPFRWSCIQLPVVEHTMMSSNFCCSAAGHARAEYWVHLLPLATVLQLNFKS